MPALGSGYGDAERQLWRTELESCRDCERLDRCLVRWGLRLKHRELEFRAVRSEPCMSARSTG